MKGTDGLVIWILGGAGAFLLYAAIANQKPQDVLAKYLGSPKAKLGPISTWKNPNTPAGTPGSENHLEAPGPLGSSGNLGGLVSYDANGQTNPLPAAYASNPNNLVQA